MTMSDFTSSSSTVMYHPSGARCTLSLPSDAQAAFNAVSEYLEVGFLVNAPVPIEGAKTLDVDYVVRCQYEYEGKTKERLYFYDLSSKYHNSAMTVYPDDDEKVKAFEQASGLTIASMPIFKGSVAPMSDSGEYFEKYARAVKFTAIRVFEEPSKKYPTGRWKLAGYGGAQTAQKPPISPAVASGATGTVDNKVTQLPPNTAQKTPEQIAAETESVDNGMAVDYTRNPSPTNKSDRTQWDAWLKRQYTMYKKVRSS
jgi:hypothetical protein